MREVEVFLSDELTKAIEAEAKRKGKTLEEQALFWMRIGMEYERTGKLPDNLH